MENDETTGQNQGTGGPANDGAGKGKRRPEHERALDHVNALLRWAHSGGDITPAEEDALLGMRRRFRSVS